MSNCVALNHFEVIDKADKTGLPKMVVGAVFGVWQKENNNYDRFPNDSEFNAILNRPKEVKTKEVTVVPSSKIKVDRSLSWTELSGLPVYFERGVNTMRTKVGNPNENFGNIYTGSGVGGLIQKANIPEAVQAFKDWLAGKIDTSIKQEKREWINNQINSGKLDNANLLYMKEKGSYYSHADALRDIVLERKEQPKFSKDPYTIPISKVKEELSINGKGGVTFKKDLYSHEINRLKKLIGNKNAANQRVGIDFVYELENIKPVGQSTQYSWELKKYPGKLDIQGVKDRIANRIVDSNQKTPNIDNRYKGGQQSLFSKGSETEYIDNKTAQGLLDKLQAKTGIVGTIVSPQKAKEILKDSLYGYNNQNAFYYKGFVYLVEGKIKKDSPFHEVAHPIVAAIQKHSPSVFNNLYKELGNTEEGKAIIAKVNQDYPELNATELQEEAIVTAIGLKAAQNITDGKFSELVDRILKVIKAFMQKVIGIKDFNDSTTLEEIAKYLSDDETIIDISHENQVKYQFKILEALNRESSNILFKRFWNTDRQKFYKELQVPKQQIEFLDSVIQNQKIDSLDELKMTIVANMSYSIEVNVSKKEGNFAGGYSFLYEGKEYEKDGNSGEYWYNLNNRKEFITSREYNRVKDLAIKKEPTSYYSNLTVPGGTNYTENEIATPAITPSIKGHAQFSTDNGIGWFRSDEQRTDDNKGERVPDGAGGLVQLGVVTDSKTRRILEVQSDLFQKGRDKKILTMPLTEKPAYESFDYNNDNYEARADSGETEYFKNGEQIEQKDWQHIRNAYEKSFVNDTDNAFLQLLNKDSNWVTFFVKSIVQDSAKKGYEKVLFPTGNTASKVEGHSTLEEFKKEKENRIKELENNKKDLKPKILSTSYIKGVTLMRLNKNDGFLKDGYAIWTDTIKDLEDKSIVTKDTTQNKHGVNFTYVNLSKQFIENNFELTVKTQEDKINNAITQYKQELERVETEGFGVLKPIFKFYEETVTNILNKQFGKENVKQITDEYGNTWNEVSILPNRDLQKVSFQKEENPFEVPADNSLLVLQYDGFKERNTSEPSKELKEVAEKLMLNRQTLTLDGELSRYIDEAGLSYERLTNFIKGFSFNGIKDYFKFEGDETLYEENREWGNQIDDIARGVLEYEDKVNCAIRWNEGINQRKSSSNAIITDRVFDEVYDYITKLRDVQFKDAVLIPQVPFKNDTKRVAGVADIVAVYPNGTIKIVDVKSSELSIYWKDYEKEFELNDTKEKRSSKENKHKAQLSGYKAMATNQGFIFNKEDELYIANLHITGLEENSNVVENVYGENPRPLTSLREIVEALQEQPKEEVIKEEGLTLIEGILKNLENRKKLLGQNKDKTTSAKLFQLEQLQKDIRDGEILVGIHKFINSVYDISEGNGTFPSMVKDIQSKVNKIQSGRITGQDIFTELLQARHQAEFLLQSAKQIKAFYQDNYENIVGEVEVDSDIDKLRRIIDSADRLERYYNKTISPLIADELAKHISKSANVEIVKEIEARESKLAKAIIKGESERVIRQYKNDIKGLKLKAGSDIGINKELLLQYLTDGSPEDISFFDAKLSSMINLSNPLISLFALKLKSALEKARITSLQLAQKNFRIFDKFAKATGRNQNDVAEFNRGLYEIVPTYAGKNEDGTDKYVDYAGFVNPTDLKAYNTAKKDFFSKKRTKAEVKAWYDENTQELPEEDEFIINPVNQEKIITLKGKNTLLEEKRELRDQDIISLREYQFWEEMILENKHQYSNTYKKELKIPNRAKYANKAYQNILDNPAMKEMYDNLLATYLKAQEELPEIGRARLGYILPGIPKNVTDLVREEGIKSWLQRSWEEKTSLMAYDTNTKVTGKNADETSKEWEHLKTIPIMFGNPLDATRTSLDLFAVVNIFTEASQMYKAQSMNKDFSEILLDNIKEKGYTQRDVFGNPVIDAAAHKLGLTNELLKYKKEVGNSNMAMMMGAMIEKNIYGKTKVSNPTAKLGKTIYVDKWYDAFAAFVGAIQIGGLNWVVPTINYLNGRVQAGIEQKAKQFFKEGSWNRAVATEAKYTINDSIKDFSNPLNKSLVGQLLDLYTPNFGTYTDQMGRTVTQSAAKKLFNTSSWFLLQNKAQHSIDTQVMLAYLMSKQVKQNGKDISLYDAYEVIDGVIQLKSGVELNDLVDTEAQNTIHALNKRMNGVYDSFNAPDIERYWYGRMFMMFRKFFIPGLKRRYKGIGVDEELGQLTEGYYITFYKALITDWKQLFKFYIGQESNLTPMEKQNVQRALREQAVLLSTGVLIMVLSAMGADDKKERQKYQWLLFLSLKLNSEIGTFGGIGDPSSGVIFPNIGEIKRTIWSLPPVIREFESILDFLTAIKNPTDTYQTTTGIHEKGDLKLPAKFWKMLSITGTNWNPETTNKWYMQQNK